MNDTLKIFLTSGMTLTVKRQESIFIEGEEKTLENLYYYIDTLTSGDFGGSVEFTVVMDGEPDEDEDDTEEVEYTHKYNIPKKSISWFMIEEVEVK